MVLIPPAKSVFMPLGLIVAASAADAGTQINPFGSRTTMLVITNKEIEEITIKLLKIGKGCC